MPKLFPATVLLLCSLSFAQIASTPQRQIRNRTIYSDALPAADLTFGKSFRYVGSQIVNLYGNAEAEQHVFVEAEANGPVTRFYWVQFEHFLPSNAMRYDYAPKRTADFGGLPFIYDVKSFPQYASMQGEDPASDGAAIGKLLAQHSLSLPQRSVRVRMFHLPTPDRRAELMIIYGEAVPEASAIPIGPDGIELDQAAPHIAKLVLAHAQKDLHIRKH